MPLPAALLARLSKRGIIKHPNPKKSAEDIEEVFAEDYDEPSQPYNELQIPDPLGTATEEVEKMEEDEELESLDTLACPNKSNPYHECTDYCRKRYGKMEFNPDPETERRRLRMTTKYPLPEGWQEIPDNATNRYYYWNIITDQVSWLSPLHPKAQITMPVVKIADILSKAALLKSGNDSDGMAIESDMDDLSGSDLDDDSEDEIEEEIEKKKVEKNNKKNTKTRTLEKLDPMDPAAYSNAPRGTWSTGLDKRGEAKTGADVTASGPLYQQRPYPAPGDVLRMNKQLDE